MRGFGLQRTAGPSRSLKMSELHLDASHDAVSTHAMRDRYAIVGVGETPYLRGGGKTTRAMATAAVRAAMLDAGMKPTDIDGMMSYQANDSVLSTMVSADLGIRLDYYMDVFGGGSSIEALVGIACGVIEAGMCRTVAIFRSMNGYSGMRMGGSGGAAVSPVANETLHNRIYGVLSPAQVYAPAFVRHMYEHGTTSEQLAAVRVIHSEHASNNPKALYKKRVTVNEVLASRMICSPLHLLDCCVETDNAAAIIVTRAERARNCRRTPVLVRGVVGRCSKPRLDMHFQSGPISRAGGSYGCDRLWALSDATPSQIDVTGAYDAFSFTTLMQLEAFGFCKTGEGGHYVSDGTMRLGGRRPNNTSGGQLCEGYAHGMNLVIENVRQLRHDADDSCPIGPDGRRMHTYDYREGGCRQVRGAEFAANLGWAGPQTQSAMVLRRA